MGTDRSTIRATEPTTAVGAGPLRTCIGCRRKDSWSVLVRTVAVKGEAGSVRVVVDSRHRMPGRGAWLHPDSSCVRSAVRRRAFGRALRAAGALDLTAVTAFLAQREQNDMTNTTRGGSDADEHPMRTSS